MAFQIQIAAQALDDLKAIRAFDRRRIIDEIHRELSNEPTKETRNRKCLEEVVPDFEYIPPLCELRSGRFRVFYDVDEESTVVVVRAVRRKEPGQTTEDIIHARNDS